MPKWSWMTLAKGAKQLVVQEALLKHTKDIGLACCTPASLLTEGGVTEAGPSDQWGLL